MNALGLLSGNVKADLTVSVVIDPSSAVLLALLIVAAVFFSGIAWKITR